MKAITYTDYGAAADVLQLVELPTPDCGPGEVLVALAYSSVNPSDVKARLGTRADAPKPPFPAVIPHSDGAGRIVAVGDGVDAARIGQRVWIWNGQWKRLHGTCATHICLPAAQAVALPEPVSMEDGASLGIPGLTATQALFCGGDVAGKTVLVQGGAGSVGGLAVQLAAWGGAHVIATGRAADHARITGFGAHAVCDYAADDLATAILAANDGRPVDHIVEVEYGLNADVDAAVIAENGRIAAYGSAQNLRPEMPFYGLMFKAVTLQMLLIYILPEAERTAAITRLHQALSEGAVTVPVDGTYTLSESAAAQAAVEAGRRAGATLIDVTTG